MHPYRPFDVAYTGPPRFGCPFRFSSFTCTSSLSASTSLLSFICFTGLLCDSSSLELVCLLREGLLFPAGASRFAFLLSPSEITGEQYHRVPPVLTIHLCVPAFVLGLSFCYPLNPRRACRRTLARRCEDTACTTHSCRLPTRLVGLCPAHRRRRVQLLD